MNHSQGPDRSPSHNNLLAYSAWLGRHYLVLWLGLGLLFVVVGSGLLYLRLNVNVDKFFLQSDANALANQEFKKKYQIGESIGIYVEGKAGLLQPERLDHLSKLSHELKRLPFVRSVQSLADLWQQSRGHTVATRLQNFRDFVAKFPELEALHSRDWQKLWLLVELYPYDKSMGAPDTLRNEGGSYGEQEAKLLADLQDQPGNIWAGLLEQLLHRYEVPGKLRFIPVGIWVNSYRLEKELSADLVKVLLIAALLCLLCIFSLLQSRLAAFATILCVLGNVLLVFGFSGWLGLVVDKTFVMIPVLLGFSSSISYCIHIEKTWEKTQKKHRGKSAVNSRQAILYRALCQNFRPLSFAALTTVLSLLSFIAVPIPMIRIAGLQSALAVSLSYFLALSLFCSLLLFCTPKASKAGKAVYAPVIAMALCCYRHRCWSLAVAGVLLLASLLLLPRLKVDLSTESILGRKFRYVRELLEVSRSEIGAGGFYNIDLLFGDEQPLAREHLQQLTEFEQQLRQTTLVKNVTSVTTFIQSVQRVYRGHAEFPDDVRQTQQALLTWERLFDGQRSQWYSEEAGSLRIMVQVRQGSSQENIAHMQEVSHLASQVFPPSVVVRPLGGVFQLAIMNQYITSGLLRSFSLSLLSVAVLLLILLRSLRIGLIALVPNLFPVLLTGAVVVVLGRSLEFVSMTVGPMVIGLAVDDTIYFLGHAQTLLRGKVYRYSQIDLIVKRSLYHVAPTLITTTLILCVLFASLLFSRAANIGYMGLYTVIAMLGALFSDLFLTPILLRWAFGRNIKR